MPLCVKLQHQERRPISLFPTTKRLRSTKQSSKGRVQKNKKERKNISNKPPPLWIYFIIYPQGAKEKKRYHTNPSAHSSIIFAIIKLERNKDMSLQ